MKSLMHDLDKPLSYTKPEGPFSSVLIADNGIRMTIARSIQMHFARVGGPIGVSRFTFYAMHVVELQRHTMYRAPLQG